MLQANRRQSKLMKIMKTGSKIIAKPIKWKNSRHLRKNRLEKAARGRRKRRRRSETGKAVYITVNKIKISAIAARTKNNSRRCTVEKEEEEEEEEPLSSLLPLQ